MDLQMPKKFQIVRENLCFVEKYYSEGKVEKADRLYQLPSQFKSSNENGGIIPYTQAILYIRGIKYVY